MKGVTILKHKDFYDRIKNFNVTATPENVSFYEEFLGLFEIKEQLANKIKENKITDGSKILEMVFQEIFQAIETNEPKISEMIFRCYLQMVETNGPPINEMVFREFLQETVMNGAVMLKKLGQKIFQEEFIKYMYDACSFTALVHFINKTQRNEGSTLTDFVYEYSPKGYNKKESSYYCPQNQVSDILMNDSRTMRKARNRILSNRAEYYKNNEWHAMPEDSETEWSLYFLLDQGLSTEVDDKTLTNLCDTYKRVKNLYNGVIMEPVTEKNIVQIIESSRKFESKLKKIKYENYLKMIKVILDHIYLDKENYGINIYRLERCLRPYTLSKEIKAVLTSENPYERLFVLEKAVLLDKVRFPKIHQYLFDFRDMNEMEYYLFHYEVLLNWMIIPVNLILDEFIDQDLFGEEWKNLFKQTINEMAKDVFYLPDEIDYSIEPKSQEAFAELLKYPVIRALRLDEIEDVL